MFSINTNDFAFGSTRGGISQEISKIGEELPKSGCYMEVNDTEFRKLLDESVSPRTLLRQFLSLVAQMGHPGSPAASSSTHRSICMTSGLHPGSMISVQAKWPLIWWDENGD